MNDPIKKKEGFQGQKAIVIPRQILDAQCARHDVLHALYLTDIGFYPKAQFHYRERPQGTGEHILIYCHEGSGRVNIAENPLPIAPGDFVVIPAETPHTYMADDANPWTIYWIHFKGTTAAPLVSTLVSQTGGYKGFIRYHEKTLELFHDMYSQLERGYGTDSLLHANLCLWPYLTTFMYNHCYHPSGQQPLRDAVDQAISFLSSSIDQALSLQQVARKVHLSPSHFSFLFKKKTGFSPIEYFNHLKVQKACQYLLFTNMRNKEIARALGMDDPYYFSRMFTKIMGMSPLHYRNKRTL